MAKKKTSRVGSFRGKISSNDARSKKGNSFSYIAAPAGVEVFSPEVETTVTFDFMPYEVKMKNHPDRDDRNGVATPGDYWYKFPFRTHKNVGVKNEKVVCLQSFGKPCPICEYRQDLKKNDGDELEIKELNTSDRNLYAINLKDPKKKKKTLHLFDASDFTFQEVFRAQLKNDPRWETFPHPTEGCSVRVVFDEASFAGNKYAKATRFDFEERDEPYEDEILDTIPNLEDCLVVLSYDQMKAKFFEASIEDDEEEEKPKAKQKAKPEPTPVSKKKPVPVEEDDDEDEEEEEEEDDDEEEEEEEVSLIEEINACKSVGALLTIATNNAEFKKELKTLNKLTKVSALKAAMLEMLEPEEEEEEDDEEEEEEEENDIETEINDAENVSDLLALAKENPEIFKAHIKELREFTKVRPMKKRMLELVEENDLPFEEEEEQPLKKQRKAEPVEEVKPSKKAASSDACPHGHKFGKDNDEYEECDDCELWNACYKKQKQG